MMFSQRVLLSMLLVAGCTQSPAQRAVDVDAGGHRLHLLVLGKEKHRPTIVLESGLGGGVGWEQVRGQLARSAQVVTYDRAGLGQSQPGPTPRDARTIADELHTALRNAKLKPPYILVGQSAGGLYAQVFAARYPDDTAGLVLVDPTHAAAHLNRPLDETRAWFMAHQPADWPRVEAAMGNAPDGLRRFLGCKYQLMETFIQTLPANDQHAMRRDWWTSIDRLLGPGKRFELTGAVRDEAMAMPEAIDQAIAARPLPKVPTILLAAGKTDLDELPPDAITPNVRALQAESRRWRLAAFQQWIDDRPGAKLVIVDDAGHDIASQRPQAVVDAIRATIR